MLQQVFNISNYVLNPFALPVLTVALLSLFVSIKVLIQEEFKVSIGFFLLGTSFVIWFTSHFFLYSTIDERVALWWGRAAYVGIPFISSAFYHFTVSILDAQAQYRKSVWTAWVLAAVFAFAIVPTDLIIGGVKHFWWGYYTQYTPLSLFYLLFATSFQTLSLIRLVQAYRGTVQGSVNNQRNRLLLIAFSIASLGYVDYLPKFGIPVYPFGYIPVLICIILIYLVLRHYRLVDITPRFASQAIIDTIKDSLLVLDSEGVVRLVNKAAVQLLGHTKHNLVGKYVSAIFDNKLFFNHVLALSDEGTINNLELSYTHPAGNKYILDLSTSIMKDERDRSLAYVFIARNITNIKQTEAELIQARDELEIRVEERSSDLKKANEQLIQEKIFSDAIIDNLPGIFYICDEEGHLLRWNDNEKEVTGYTQQELMNMNVLQLFDQDREAILCKMAEVFEAGQAALEASLVTKSGMQVPFYLSGFCMEVKDKRYLVGVGINISERNRLEQQLHQSQKMEAVGLLAGGVAHDFNNILSAIVGYASLMDMKMDPHDPLRYNVAQILVSSERAAALTNSLLAFSRKQAVNLRTLNINDVVSGFYKILIRLIGEDIEFNLNLSPDKVLVRADKGQLEQVLMNLVTNARDAMPQGGKLTITTGSTSLHGTRGELRSGPYAIISVSDTGMGIDSEKQKHIFEPFYTTKEVGKGTGLGLAIVYGIITKHDGTVMLDSEPGRGTTFTVYLPEEQTMISADEADAQELHLAGHETVLLIEDDASVRKITRAILEEYGYSVLEASNGDEAIDVFRKNPNTIHIVLCDLIMPKKNGKETYNDLVKIRPDIKTIFVSGYTSDILAQRGLDASGLHFISKPFDPSKLLTKVRAVLNSP